MNARHLSFAALGAVLLLASGPAQAQLAPTPKKSPTTPVSKEYLAGKTAPTVMPSQILEGSATVLDAGRVRVKDVELRLFGIVPPLLGASFGPQARAVIDSLSQGTVTCRIKDRERTGSYLATCHNEANADFGLELLRRGLAASARGSLSSSDFAGSYIAAEQAAQNQRLGIWSASVPSALSDKNIREATEAARAEKAESEKIIAEAEKAKQAAERAKAEAAAAQAALPPPLENPGPNYVAPVVISTASDLPLPSFTETTSKDFAASPMSMSNTVPSLLAAPAALQSALPVEAMGFFERYQLLTTGLIGLVTALGIAGCVLAFKIRQHKDELRSIAAALRGELMAARSVCQARLAKIAHEGTDRNASWPRIRILVFQAYVGRLGCLGADLSRQIASIYGMASDYASFYNTTEARSESSSKRQALEALIQHIEEVTPRLAQIENTGCLPTAQKPVSFTSVLPSPKKPLSLSSQENKQQPDRGEAQGSDERASTRSDDNDVPPPGRPASPSDVEISLIQARDEIVETTKAKEERDEQSAKAAAQPEPKATTTAHKRPATTQTMTRKPATTSAAHDGKVAALAAKFVTKTPPSKVQAPPHKGAVKIHEAAQTALRSVAAINFKAPIFERLSKLKDFASHQLDTEKKTIPDLTEYTIPDYANLTEEELEALLYAEEEMLMASPVGKSHKAG